jgi:hypothetical protein
MAVTMKNAVSWDVMPCGSCKNRRFGGMYRLHHQGDKNWRTGNNVSSVLRLLITANVVPSSQILSTLMMDAIPSFETSVLTGSTKHHIPEDGILRNFTES